MSEKEVLSLENLKKLQSLSIDGIKALFDRDRTFLAQIDERKADLEKKRNDILNKEMSEIENAKVAVEKDIEKTSEQTTESEPEPTDVASTVEPANTTNDEPAKPITKHSRPAPAGIDLGFTSSRTFSYNEKGQRMNSERTGTGYGAPRIARPAPGFVRDNMNSTVRGSTRPPSLSRRPVASDIVNKPSLGAKPVDKKKKTGDFKDDKKQPLNKKSMIRKGYAESGMIIIDDEAVRHVKVRRKKQEFTPDTVNISNAVITTPEIAIKTLAEKIGITSARIVKKLFDIGETKTVNDIINFEQAELMALEFGVTLEYKPDVTAEDKLLAFSATNADGVELVKRPPVVTIMGHVDHGKTSLLDYIRKGNVALGEAGGITQHIGAYTVELDGKPITFLDTPGHEAFTSMRLRGAMVTDIAVIVVSADDGIMPQTIEAINHAKRAGVSVMVAINKIDKPTANVDKVKEQLTHHELVPEEWGGDVIVCPVSAKTGQGVKELLENILLLADVKDLKANVACSAQGSIIEARLDKGTGPVATVLIQNGTLKVSDFVVAGNVTGKIRAMTDYAGKRVAEAGPSIAVSVLGFSEVPSAGDQLIVVSTEKMAKQVAEERIGKERFERQKTSFRTLEDMFKNVGAEEKKVLNVLVKGDVQGSVEAIKQALDKLNDELAEKHLSAHIVHIGVGAVNESDVMLADASDAVIICFNVRPEPKAKATADRSGVDIKTYRVIYDVIDDVEKALKGMLEPVFKEEIIGHAEIRQVFKVTGVGTIAGSYVTDGKISRNAKMRLIRDNTVVYEGQVSSLKRVKDDVKDVAAGYECGIGLDKFNDLKAGDIIEAFLLTQEKQD